MGLPLHEPGPGVPDELVNWPQWVAYRTAPARARPGKLDKIPINPRTGHNASTTDRETWGAYEEATRFALENGLDGVGFVFSPDDPYVGIDLDDCVDEEGRLAPEAERIVTELGSYAEWSPSGCGIHIIVKGKLPPGRRRTGSIEIYERGRFFTMTGRRLPNAPSTIEERQQELEQLFLETFGEEPPPAPGSQMPPVPVSLGDEELLQKARSAANGGHFAALWEGDHSGYPSASEADLALCGMLAFWTRLDPERIDRLFRQSGLFRPKWDERHSADGRTYGELTIDRALEGRHECYTGSHGPHGNARNGTAETARSKERATWRLTDVGNAERLVHHHGDDLRYCPQWGKWLVWDGQRWAVDDLGVVNERAKDTVRRIYAEASNVEDEDRHKAIAKWARHSESQPRLKAMIDLARSDPAIAVESDKLDADPWLLNCQNGTVYLRTGQLRPHSRSDLCTKMAPVDFDPEADCPMWMAFLATILNGNQELINYVLRCIGYTLTGDISEQVLFFLYGTGANGKTTLTEVLRSILGDYAQKAPQEMLTVRRYDGGVPNHIARLKGARLATLNEVEEGRQLAEAQVKDLTGGDTITARFMRAEWFDCTPTHKLLMQGNHKPAIRGTDDGIWRRIRLIPFTVTIAESERDPHLKDKLLGEAPGILAWAVRGCLDWQREGLGTPADVRVATDSYRAELDILAQFLEECCVRQEDATVGKGELYSAYREWCLASGESPLEKRKFGSRLREKGFGERKSGKHMWVGVGLLESEP